MRFLRLLVRWLMFSAALAGAALAIWYFMQPRPISVDVAEVTRGALIVTVDEDGQTRIKERYIVSAPLSGRLLRVELEPGDILLQYSTRLAAIAPRNPELLDKRERQQSEMLVKAREAALKRSLPIVKSANSAFEYAQQNYERMRKLAPERAASEDEFDKAVMEKKVREEAVRAALYAQKIAQYELDVARAALVRTQTEEEPDYTDFEMFSPINGRVLRVMQESATVVSPGSPLLEIGDPTDLEIVVDVLSSDAVKIVPGTTVFLERWGGDEPLHGTVRLVEPAAFTKISALGVEEQRVNVVIDLEEPVEERFTLGDGYRVEAKIVVWQADDVLKIPSGALFRDRGVWSIFVMTAAGRASLRPVTVGKQNDREAQVLDGLELGQTVILHPSDKLQDGGLVVAR